MPQIDADLFKKLMKLEEDNFWIYYDGSRVVGLFYDYEMEQDLEEFIIPNGCMDARELCCTFVFEDDPYGSVCTLDAFNVKEWSVVNPQPVDWRNLS